MVAHLGLPLFDIADVVCSWNSTKTVEQHAGGQAKVYIFTWTNPVPAPTSQVRPAIPEGQRVALKQLLQAHGGRSVSQIRTEEDLQQAVQQRQRALSLELNLLHAFHSRGCGDRMIKPLGMVQYPGYLQLDAERRRKEWWQPTYGYLMPAYPRSSVSKLLTDICHRAALPRPAHSRQRVLHPAGRAGPLPHHARLRLQLQDITANNLLVDDSGQGMRLLFADPAMALPISVLEKAEAWTAPVIGTWLSGSMKARGGTFDPTADLHSLSFVFAQMWLAAEGSPAPVSELIQEHRLNTDRAQGVRFVRSVVAQVLHSQLNGGTIGPRVKRHLPASWLGAWALLLGFRDYQHEEQMRLGLPCLRPGAARGCVRGAGAVPRLPLVGDMCRLLSRLLQLSRLEAAPEDPDLKWLAANFMQLQHPLVAAMKAQGAVGTGAPEPPCVAGGWTHAVHAAQRACGYAPNSLSHIQARAQESFDRWRERGVQASVWMWYERVAAQLRPDQLLQESVAASLRKTAAEVGVQVTWPLPAAAPASNGQQPAAAAAPVPAAAAAPVPAAAPAPDMAAQQVQAQTAEGAQHVEQQVQAAAPPIRPAAPDAAPMGAAVPTAAAAQANEAEEKHSSGVHASALRGLQGVQKEARQMAQQAVQEAQGAAKPVAGQKHTPAGDDSGSRAQGPPAVHAVPGAASGHDSGSLTATAQRKHRSLAAACAAAAHRRTPAAAATPAANRGPSEFSGPPSKRPRRAQTSTVLLSAGVASPAPGVLSAGGGARVPANSGPNGIYPWPNAAFAKDGSGGERWERWLERIQPRLVAGIYGAVVPGGGQLELFKAITSLELADQSWLPGLTQKEALWRASTSTRTARGTSTRRC
ncbi:hypothetical protein ABPG77_004410 [Micractinium sp. CCAP 211/92]